MNFLKSGINNYLEKVFIISIAFAVTLNINCTQHLRLKKKKNTLSKTDNNKSRMCEAKKHKRPVDSKNTNPEIFINPETFLNSKYIYKLPDLPYEFDALNPYIDTLTMKIHHNKHHQGYVNKLNTALKEFPKLQKFTLKELLSNLDKLPLNIRTKIRDNAGGHFNHSLFWNVMSPNTRKVPQGLLSLKIKENFKSYDNFKAIFSKAAKKIFGSGWAWLSIDKNNNLIIHVTEDQNSPIELGFEPLLALDVWEHAYYLKYKNERDKYINNWFNIINWPYIEKYYNRITQSKNNLSLRNNSKKNDNGLRKLKN